MNRLRFFSLSLLVVVICVVSPSHLYSLDKSDRPGVLACNDIWSTTYNPVDFSAFINSSDTSDFFETLVAETPITIVKTPTDGGIREDFPDKYKDRFEKWEAEMRSTEFGRQQWDTYANRKNFILTIRVSGDKGKGAGTDKFLWDESGNFVGATITLGDDIDEGYPDPIYYPVLNSLSSGATSYSISGKILASTKMSHEIGHVNQTAKANLEFLRLQNKLMPEYTSIFLKNGRNIKDKKLVEMARQMGGTPVEIWESREYWSEVNAMLFLKERISKEDFYCYVFNKIKRNVETYAKDYEHRFGQYSDFSDSPCGK